MSGKLSVGEIVVGEGVTREIVLGKLRWGNDLFSPTNVVNLKFMNCVKSNNLSLKGVFAKNERGYRLNAIKALLVATNLTSICCVYKEKIVKDVSHRRA